MAITINPGERIEIRGVLAGAYKGRKWVDNAKACLTHAVVIGVDNRDVRTLCRKIPIDHMCDQIEPGPVSCPTCFTRLEGLLTRFPDLVVVSDPPKDLNAS